MAQLKIDAQPDTICSTIFFDPSCIVFHIESSQRSSPERWRKLSIRGDGDGEELQRGVWKTAAPEDGCRSKVSRCWD